MEHSLGGSTAKFDCKAVFLDRPPIAGEDYPR